MLLDDEQIEQAPLCNFFLYYYCLLIYMLFHFPTYLHAISLGEGISSWSLHIVYWPRSTSLSGHPSRPPRSHATVCIAAGRLPPWPLCRSGPGLLAPLHYFPSSLHQIETMTCREKWKISSWEQGTDSSPPNPHRVDIKSSLEHVSTMPT